jgi:hypothetical protein
VTRFDDWSTRVYSSSVAKAMLGFGYEYWILDPTRYEGNAALRAKAAQLGWQWTKRQLAYALVEHLLTDVIAAAGGVEQSLITMRNALAEAQAWSDEHAAPRHEPGVPHNVGNPSITKAWYEFANLLSWARAVEERLDRRPPFPKKGVPGLPRQGLVNAVKPARLKKRLNRLLADLRAGPMAETRLLANFTLHTALVRSPESGARLMDTGKLRLPLPDTPTSAIFHVNLLTWNDNRDAMEFAELLWASIEEFIDKLLTAFEKSVPKRLRR